MEPKDAKTQSISSAEEQHDDLGCEDAEEHRERVDRRVAQGGGLLRADAVGIGQCGRVGIGTGYHTHDGEVVELELQTGYRADYQDGNDRDEETRQHVEQSVALNHRVEEVGTRLDAHAGQEQHQSDLTQHHVGRCCGIGDKAYLIAVAANENSDDQRAAGDTELHGDGHAGNGDGQ